MAARRRIRNAPARSTQTPRRNPARPGMGGSNPGQPRRNTPANGFWQGNQNPPQSVGRALGQLGFDAPAQGFGFDQHQQTALLAELARMQQGLAGREPGSFDFNYNPHLGIAGNLGQFERQIGMEPHRIAGFGADQQQQHMFGRATGYGGPWPQQGPPIQQGPPGQQGQFPPIHPFPQAHHDPPGQTPPIINQGNVTPAQVQYPAAGQMPYSVPQQPPPPQSYSPGYGPHGPPQQPPPQSYSPGYGPHVRQQQPPPQSYSPGYGPHVPQGAPVASPQQQAMAGAYGQQPPQQGVMPPFQEASPGGPASPNGGPNQFGFQPLQLPGWNHFVQGYYGEMPKAPGYLTGAGVQEQQGLYSGLQNELAGLQSQYGQIAPQYNLQGQRMMTNYGLDENQLAWQLGARGTAGAGIDQTQNQQLQGNYNRQFQDLSQAAQGQVSGLYGQAGSAFDQTLQQLLNLYSQQAQQQASNPNAPYQARRPKRKAKK